MLRDVFVCTVQVNVGIILGNLLAENWAYQYVGSVLDGTVRYQMVHVQI
jgi:hypothetical protein